MINSNLIKEVAKKIDSLFDWQKIVPNKVIGSLAELADGYLLSYGFDYLNSKFGDKIPVNFVDEIELALLCFVDGDYLGMLNAIPDGLDEAFDIKFLEGDFEAIFIATNFNAMFKAAAYYAALKA